MPMNKKPTPKATPKGARQFDKGDRDKMKIYGDIPDPRPRGRVYTPELLGAAKKAAHSKRGIDMPLNAKGKKIKAAMAKQYGKERGERVFYAAENKGSIKGVTKKGKKK